MKTWFFVLAFAAYAVVMILLEKDSKIGFIPVALLIIAEFVWDTYAAFKENLDEQEE